MSVCVEIPSVLRRHTGGEPSVNLAAGSVREVLDELKRSDPPLYSSICDETGSVRPHINIFVNGTLVRGQDQFARPLDDGDVISLFQAVSGG